MFIALSAPLLIISGTTSSTTQSTSFDRWETSSFENDTSSLTCKDDVLTYLIHLGYLGYDQEKEMAFIPNEEIRQELGKAVKFCIYSETRI